MTTRRWPMLGVLLTAHLSFAVLGWLVLLGGVAVLMTSLAIWAEPDRSIWHQAATQVPRWFALGLGVDAITTYLRLHLAHGRTRRDFLRQLLPYVVVLAAGMSVLLAIGYVAEYGVYSLIGWSQNIPANTLFDSALDVPGLLGAFTLLLLLWTVAGTLLGAAFTRNFGLGLLTVPVAFGMVALSEVLVGIKGIPLTRDLAAAWQLPLAPTVGLSIAAAGVGAALTWGIVRDIPLRPRVA